MHSNDHIKGNWAMVEGEHPLPGESLHLQSFVPLSKHRLPPSPCAAAWTGYNSPPGESVGTSLSAFLALEAHEAPRRSVKLV